MPYARANRGTIGRPVACRPVVAADDPSSAAPIRSSQYASASPTGVAMPPAMPARPVLLTVAQVAQQLQISESKVRAHACGKQEPKLPCVRLGATVRFRQDSLDRFLEASEKRSVT